MKENTFFDVCIPTVNLIFFPFKSLNTDYNSVFNKNRQLMKASKLPD